MKVMVQGQRVVLALVLRRSLFFGFSTACSVSRCLKALSQSSHDASFRWRSVASSSEVTNMLRVSAMSEAIGLAG